MTNLSRLWVLLRNGSAVLLERSVGPFPDGPVLFTLSSGPCGEAVFAYLTLTLSKIPLRKHDEVGVTPLVPNVQSLRVWNPLRTDRPHVIFGARWLAAYRV